MTVNSIDFDRIPTFSIKDWLEVAQLLGCSIDGAVVSGTPEPQHDLKGLNHFPKSFFFSFSDKYLVVPLHDNLELIHRVPWAVDILAQPGPGERGDGNEKETMRRRQGGEDNEEETSRRRRRGRRRRHLSCSEVMMLNRNSPKS